MLDEETIRLAVSGDQDAFVTVIRTYEVVLYRIAYSYVRNEHDAKEAIQELSYRCYRAIHQLEHPRTIGSWLTRMIINICHDMLRKRKRELLIEQIDPVAEASYEEQHKVEWLELLDQLEEEQRELIYLKYVEDYSNQSIASHLQVPEGTVKSRLHHTLKKLRGMFREERY